MAASDYPNGRIPLSELSQIGFNAYGEMQYLEPTAARYWVALVIKAASQTMSLNALEGYRSYDEQVRLRNLYLSGAGNPAGIPGTSSHGWGKAVDVYNAGNFGGAKHDWLTLNAPAYGYTNTQGRADGEPWHWVFGTPTIPAGNLGSATPGHIGITENGKHKMRLLKPQSGPYNGYGIAYGEGRLVCSPGPNYDAAWTAEIGEGFRPCNQDELNMILTLNGIPWDVVAEAIKPNRRGSTWRETSGWASTPPSA